MTLAFLLLVSAQTGCSTASSDSNESPRLTVELRQNRDQYADRAAVIRVSNPGDTEVVVTRVAVSGSAFAGATERDRLSAIPAGQTKDLAVELPPAACDAAVPHADATLTLESGATIGYDDLADPTEVLARVHTADCVGKRVAAIATVTVHPDVRLEGTGPATVAILAVTIAPAGGPGTLELIRLRSTVLLQPASGPNGEAAGEDWPIGTEIDASSDPRTLEFRIVPTRCDPHALAEDKVGTLFPLVVSIDSGAEASLTLPLPPGTAEALKEAVRARCA